MKKREWTEEQINFIKDNYLNMTRDEISEKISCPLSALARKMRELNLYKRVEEPEIGEKIEGTRLTIKEKNLVFDGKQNKTMATCYCECGKTTTQRLSSITQGKIVSCGCWKAEKAGERIAVANFKHGKGNKENRLYRIWCAMKTRCNNKNIKEFSSYGGRGITIYEEWEKDFISFEKWALDNGYQDNLSIERNKIDGNYEPGNCSWISIPSQQRNKQNSKIDRYSITAFGQTKLIREWVEDPICKVNANALCYRLESGYWDIEDAITTPSQREEILT